MADLAPVTYNTTIAAPPEHIYPALIQRFALSQWLSNSAFVSYRAYVGGAYFLNWDWGHRVTGTFTALQPGERAAMTWRADDEPATAQVEFTLVPGEGGTTLTVSVTGLADTADGQLVRANHQHGWDGVLDNLKYFIENGLDQRLMRRPMLGIFLSPMTPELRAKYAVPEGVDGIVIDGVAEGSGAASAGLQSGDVMVSLDGKPVNSYEMLGLALNGKVGGDTIPVVFYRASERHDVPLTLGKRPLPEVPTNDKGVDMGAVAARYRERVGEILDEIEEMISGVPEMILSRRPQVDEWSVNENLAHLLWAERYTQMDHWSVVGGGGLIEWIDNNPVQLTPILTVYPTSTELLAAMRREIVGTTAQVEQLPEYVRARPTLMMLMAQNLFHQPDHIGEHRDQVRAVLNALHPAT